MRHTKITLALIALIGTVLLIVGPASAQTVKIGFIGTYSGPGAPQGDQLDKGFKLFMKLNGDKLPPGVKVETIVRDDTGPNPDNGKRVAQELIVRDKVHFLVGVIWTPNARAIAPLTAEAKVPFISANAAGVDVPYMSPYFARVSFTLWQSCYPLGQWAAKKYKRVYTAVSDFAPGHEAEEGDLGEDVLQLLLRAAQLLGHLGVGGGAQQLPAPPAAWLRFIANSCLAAMNCRTPGQ